MTTTNITSSNSVFRGFPKKQGQVYKISIENEPELYVTRGIRGRSGKGEGKFHKIREVYIDRENWIYVGFIARDESGQFNQYAAIGRLHVLQEEVV